MPKFTRSFIMGSWAYGKPNLHHEFCGECSRDIPDSGSDVDLVVLVSKDDLGILTQECDDDQGTEYSESSRSLRFGKLDLICLLKDEDFQARKMLTKTLKQVKNLRENGVITREEAIALFNRVTDPIFNRFDYSFPFIKEIARQRLRQKKK